MSRKSSHEPWTAKGPYIFAGKDCIAICDTDNDTPEAMAAKAQLIAAAPEMAKALKALLDAGWRTQDAPDDAALWDEARAALAKAGVS